MTDDDQSDKLRKTDDEWRAQLTPEAYRVARQAGTERPFTGEYVATTEIGTYACVCCGTEIFRSNAQFDAGCGWPSFWEPLAGARISEHEDISLGVRRVEVTCSRCDAHLGHVFSDGPPPTGLRYCINSVCLTLRPDATAGHDD